MFSLNKQQLIGTLADDAEGRSIPQNGGTVTNLRVVTYDHYKDRTSGEQKEIREFHRVVVFGQNAEVARDYKRGDMVYVEGRSRTRKYEQRGEVKYVTEVHASAISLWVTRDTGDASSQPSSRADAPQQHSAPDQTFDDTDRPF